MDAPPTAETPEIQALLDRARARDPEAAGALLELFRARLRRMVELRLDDQLRRKLGASDVVQEAFLEAARRFEEYLARPSMPFHLWLRFLTAQTLAALWRHHVGTQARDVRREAGGRALFTSSETLAGAMLAHTTSPTRAAARDEARSQVAAALGLMDPVDREVLVLRHFEGLSNAEAAQEVGLSPDAARKRHARALVRLREILARFPGAGAGLLTDRA